MKKNNFLNLIKLISAILVIFIHCKFKGVFGDLIATLATFAVPFFFIITGYFFSNNSTNKIKNNIFKYLKKYIFLLLLYFCLKIILIIVFDSNLLGDYLKEFKSVKNILLFIIFNNTTPIASHLWYLGALSYCYIFIYIFMNKKNIKLNKYLIIIPFLEIPISILFISKFGMEYSTIFRNWLTIGLPFLGIGDYVRRNEKKLIQVKCRYLLLIFIFGFIITVIEKIIIKTTFNIQLNLYYGVIIMSVSIFLICLKNNKLIIKDNLFLNISEYIYYYHYVFVIVFNFFREKLNLDVFEPLAILLLTLLVSILIYKFRKEQKNENK